MGIFTSAALAKRYLSLRPVTRSSAYTGGDQFARSVDEYTDESSATGFHAIFSLDLRGRDVLDLGCGYGGRTVYYKEMGARTVIGIEIAEETVREAVAFAESKGSRITGLVGCGEQIPLPDDSIDVITSYDVFEHVESLPRTLAECLRVLRSGGSLYAVFPPFFHPTGGSHLHGYVSASPIPNLIFSCAALRRAIDEILVSRGDDWRPHDRPTDALPTVNGTTIAKFEEMLRSLQFSRKSVRLDPLKSRQLWWLNGLPAVGTHIPLLREICTSRIVCVLTK